MGNGVGRLVGSPPENFFHLIIPSCRCNGTGRIVVRDDAVYFFNTVLSEGPGSTDIAKEEAAALGFWVGSRLLQNIYSRVVQ